MVDSLKKYDVEKIIDDVLILNKVLGRFVWEGTVNQAKFTRLKS